MFIVFMLYLCMVAVMSFFTYGTFVTYFDKENPQEESKNSNKGFALLFTVCFSAFQPISYIIVHLTFGSEIDKIHWRFR